MPKIFIGMGPSSCFGTFFLLEQSYQILSDDAELLTLGQRLCVGLLQVRFSKLVQKFETSGLEVRQSSGNRKWIFIRFRNRDRPVFRIWTFQGLLFWSLKLN